MHPAASLPETKILTFLSAGAEDEPQGPPIAFTQAEILAFSEVREWLANGYELDSFDNKLSPKDPHQVILLVVLTRRPEAA
ncbi:hypothetical protein [Hymenobacter baengnokdamensis]|uniref:hypothetical protein n=1 Tax=Hymenobacter baengnokdamensis TaxID=2615203 RepID=UPI0012485139|nr:hypothetical protein [Hymenobacter baengnokdamensis]